MRKQLRGRHVLDRDRVMRGVGNYGIAGRIVMGCRQEGGSIRKYALAELDCICCGIKVCKGDLAEIGREHKRVVFSDSNAGARVGAGDLA
jgi:hypothetical protein